MNQLLDVTKSARIEFGLDWLHELKVAPDLKALLLEEKPNNIGWGDFAIFSMLSFVLMARIMRFDLRGVIRLAVRVVGMVPGDGTPNPTSAGSPGDERKSLAKAAK